MAWLSKAEIREDAFESNFEATSLRARGNRMERLIRPVEREWPDVAATKAAVDAWEAANGIALPADYRAFMLRYGGGRVYPLIFDCTIPRERYPTTDERPATYLDLLYEWTMVERIWNGAMFGNRNPPGLLVIGCNPGGLEVLLGVRPPHHGKIFTWLHTPHPWGDPDNDTFWLQADSFRAFMESLYENERHEGYDYWHLPGLKHLERPLEF
jgi:hypothetical protein